jgi:hypothetical protein
MNSRTVADDVEQLHLSAVGCKHACGHPQLPHTPLVQGCTAVDTKLAPKPLIVYDPLVVRGLQARHRAGGEALSSS